MSSTLKSPASLRGVAGQLLLLLTLFLLGFLFFWESLTFDSYGDPTGPGTVPFFLAASLLLFTFLQSLYVVQGSEQWTKTAAPAPKIFLVWCVFALCALYLTAVHYIGYYSSTAVFIVSLGVALGMRRYLALVALSLAWLLLVFGIFEKLLQLPIPQGVLWKLT